MRYQLNLEVKLMEVPEPPTMPKPGEDPIIGIGAAVSSLAGIVHAPFRGELSGIDFRKSVELSVADFAEATLLLRRFHNLLEEIEYQNLSTTHTTER